MRTRRLILLVMLVFGLGVAYVFQRDLCLRLVRRQARQEAELRVLVEERDRRQVEMERLVGFGRLDSVWVSVGGTLDPGGYRHARAGDRPGPAEPAGVPEPTEGAEIASLE